MTAFITKTFREYARARDTNSMTGCIWSSGLKCCGQDATCTVGYEHAVAYCASGFEFSPQMSPDTVTSSSSGSAFTLPVVPGPCTRRSPTVGTNF